MSEANFLSEDDGAHLVCNSCGQQVRSNEAHTCPGPPNTPRVVEQLADLRKAFIENGDFNDIPMDQAVQILDEAIDRLDSGPEEKHFALVVNLDFVPSPEISDDSFLENLEYEFTCNSYFGKITHSEIMSWQRR